MVAKTFFGFEDILADELRNLGAMHITKGVRSVQFEGDKGFMYKANLCLRTALKILKPIHSFYIRNEKEYYQKLYDFNWQEILDLNQTFAVTAILRTEISILALCSSRSVLRVRIGRLKSVLKKVTKAVILCQRTPLLPVICAW